MTSADSLLASMTTWPERFNPMLVRVGPLPRLAACGRDTLTNHLICPPVSGNGVTAWVRVHFENELYESQTAFDQASTDFVTVYWAMTAHRPTGDGASISSGSGLIGVHDLLQGSPLLSGWTSMTTQWSHQGNSGSITTDLLISELVLPSDAGGYPGSGTITLHSHGPGYQDTGPIDLQMVMTFNGTPIVSVQRTEHGVTRSCTWDLRPRDPEMGNGLTCAS